MTLFRRTQAKSGGKSCLSTDWLGEGPTPAAIVTLYVAATCVKEMFPWHRPHREDDERSVPLFLLIRTTLPDTDALVNFDELAFMHSQDDRSVTNCSERVNQFSK